MGNIKKYIKNNLSDEDRKLLLGGGDKTDYTIYTYSDRTTKWTDSNNKDIFYVKCINCDKTFESTLENTTYCSRDCRNEYDEKQKTYINNIRVNNNNNDKNKEINKNKTMGINKETLQKIKDYGNMPLLIIVFSFGIILFIANYVLLSIPASTLSEYYSATETQLVDNYKTVSDSVFNASDSTYSYITRNEKVGKKEIEVIDGISYWNWYNFFAILSTLKIAQAGLTFRFKKTGDKIDSIERKVINIINYSTVGGWVFIVCLLWFGVVSNTETVTFIDKASLIFTTISIAFGWILDLIIGTSVMIAYRDIIDEREAKIKSSTVAPKAKTTTSTPSITNNDNSEKSKKIRRTR